MHSTLYSMTGNIRLHLIGTLVSALVYGILTSVFLQSLLLLIANKKKSYTYRTRYFLICYIISMFVFSSVAIIQAFVFILNPPRDTENSLNIFHLNEPMTLPLTIWGADGFMIWRCFIVYNGGTSIQRSALRMFLAIITFLSLACPFLYYLGPRLSTLTGKSSPNFLFVIMAICITTAVNFVLTSLISGRLWYHQESMRQALGPQYGSPYMRLIAMCVESCVLIVITSLAFVILFALGNHKSFGGAIIPLLLLPHVCALSPTLLVYHVARGRAAATISPSDIKTPNVADILDNNKRSIIQFGHPSTLPGDSTSSAASMSSGSPV